MSFNYCVAETQQATNVLLSNLEGSGPISANILKL